MAIATLKLKGRIIEKGKNIEIVSREIGIDKSTFYRKMQANGENFTIREVLDMAKTIPLTKEEAISIFLDEIE